MVPGTYGRLGIGYFGDTAVDRIVVADEIGMAEQSTHVDLVAADGMERRLHVASFGAH